MAFSEALKKQVRRRAHQRCCICHAIGVEIHHIVPQEQDGPDTEDNAAPLCPSCHDTYGANPVKRKFIREARDHWFEICDKRYASDDTGLSDIKPYIDEKNRHLEGLQAGGDTFCYWMLYHFDLAQNIAQNFVVIKQGQYPLYDVRIRIHDADLGKDILEASWGEINAPADYQLGRWPIPENAYFRAFFHARNGSWHQDLILRKSSAAQCWRAATRVLGRSGDTLFEHIDLDFEKEFGLPAWRP